MSYTLRTTLNQINMALDFPSITIQDTQLYFDQAIEDLNSELHIAIPSITELVSSFGRKVSKTRDIISITSTDITVEIPTVERLEDATTNVVLNQEDSSFYYKKNDKYIKANELYGINLETQKEYKAYAAASSLGYWTLSEKDYLDIDLNDYLPTSAIVLYLIPYICAEYASKSGGNASLFNDKFTEGFLQIVKSYDIPSFVNLVDVAHLPAYHDLVIKHGSKLDTEVSTRAIYEDMKVNKTFHRESLEFYDRGGFF